MADVRELALDPSDQYSARPMEENMFEWHFVLRGPSGTDFQGGRYHGKILLPAEYPFKPPNIVFLTPNGRWETKTKICLSISAYHPELWQPAWGIRTILEALISFMPAPADGALGAVDSTPETRKRLALESMRYAHPLMPELPELGTGRVQSKAFAEAVAQICLHAPKTPETLAGETKPMEGGGDVESTGDVPVQLERSEVSEVVQAEIGTEKPETVEAEQPEVPVHDNAVATPVVATVVFPVIAASHEDHADEFLRFASWMVVFAIFVISYRKLLMAYAPEL